MDAKRYTSSAWPIAIVLLTGIYGYWAAQRSLESSRPSLLGQHGVPPPTALPGLQTTHSRLWQDPLTSCYEHLKKLQQYHENQPVTEPLAIMDSEELTRAVGQTATGSPLDAESRGGKFAALSVAVMRAADSRFQFFATSSSAISESGDQPTDVKVAHARRSFFQDLVDKSRTICMPVFVPGGPYTEDKEERMRIRYAVVAGLAESGYHLKYPRRMSYFTANVPTRVLRGWREQQMVIPTKLFRHDDGRPQILVLWINDDQLGLRPLLTTHRILHAAFSDVTEPSNLEIAMVGPASSGTLEHMTREIEDLNDTYYPRAIHEASEAAKTDSHAFDCVLTKYSEIRKHAEAIEEQTTNHSFSGSEKIREKAIQAGSPQTHDRWRELADEIEETASGDDEDSGEIREKAQRLREKVDDAQRESDEFLDQACQKIHELGERLAQELKQIGADFEPRESLLREADVLSDRRIPYHARLICEHVGGVFDARAPDRREVASRNLSDDEKAIRNSLDEIVRMEIVFRVDRFVRDIKEDADEASRSHREHGKIANNVRDKADSLYNSWQARNERAGGAPGRNSYAQGDEILGQTLKALKGDAESIRKEARQSGRPKVRQVGRLAEEFETFAHDSATMLESPNFLQWEPITPIQRAAKSIREILKQAHYNYGDDGELAEDDACQARQSIVEQATRIALAHAHSLRREATVRIQQGLEEMRESAESANEKAAPANEEYIDELAGDAESARLLSDQTIVMLAQRMPWNERAGHWFIAAYQRDDGLVLKRAEGFLPLLQAHAMEETEKEKGRKTRIFSPRATMHNLRFEPNNLIDLHRVIDSDQQLAKRILQELNLRIGSDAPIILITEHDTTYGREFARAFRSAMSVDYSRNVTHLFKRHNCSTADCHGPKELEQDFVVQEDAEKSPLVYRLQAAKKFTPHWIPKKDLETLRFWIDQGASTDSRSDRTRQSNMRSLTILRGIDGKLPDHEEDGKSANGDRGTDSSGIPKTKPNYPPEGRSQYDYLIRQRERIEQEVERGDVKAIGVVGNDVYDKLLVLRALRPHFPNIVFFTTDLYANYGEPDEALNARNLLIASHFDLRLNDQLQPRTPPFRDSYQTATFLATRLAAQHTDPIQWRAAAGSEANCESDQGRWHQLLKKYLDDDECPDPVLSVVGVNDLYRVPELEQQRESSSVHPAHPPVDRAWRLFYFGSILLAVVALGVLVVYRNRFTTSPLLRQAPQAPILAWLSTPLHSAQRFLRPSATQRKWAETGNRFLRSALLKIRSLGRSSGWGTSLPVVVLSGLLLLGLISLVTLATRRVWGHEAVALLGGYSSDVRKMIQVSTGILALVSVAYLWDEFSRQARRLQMRNRELAALATHGFTGHEQMRILACAIIVLAIVFHAIQSDVTWFLIVFGSSVAVALVRRSGHLWPSKRRRRVAEHRRTPSEASCQDFALGSELALVLRDLFPGVVIAELLWYLGDVRGWVSDANTWGDLASTSRGFFSQWTDTFAMIFAFGCVILLFCSIIYFHFWCRGFSRRTGFDDDALGRLMDQTDIRELPRTSSDLLYFVSRLTTATHNVTVALLALMALLLVAYFPQWSPAPMPQGLLLATTVGAVGLLLSHLTMRWYFTNLRDETAAVLQLWSHNCEESRAPTGHGTADDGPEPPSPSTSHEQASDQRQSGPAYPRHLAREAAHVNLQDDFDVVPASAGTSAAVASRPDRTCELATTLKHRIAEIEDLSQGVFLPWARSPVGWMLGGGAMVALIETWMRSWTLGM